MPDLAHRDRGREVRVVIVDADGSLGAQSRRAESGTRVESERRNVGQVLKNIECFQEIHESMKF